jgi:hypothetical protein
MGRHSNHIRTGLRARDRSGRIARTTAAIAAAAITFAACGGDDEASTAAAEATAEAAAPSDGDDAGIDELAIGGESASATTSPVTDPAAPDGGRTVELGAVGRDVIVEMYVTLSSPNLPRSVAQITARAASLGGGAESSTIDYGDPAAVNPPEAYAILVVKVPPAEVEQLIGDLADAGTVRSLEQSAQDVTEQLVDLDVRIANARRSVENVRGFMERAANLTELVSLEAELTRRQTELEQLEAQQRNLVDRVALATITIDVRPETALPAPDSRGGVRGAFADGWDSFVTVVRGVVIVLAVLAPFLVAFGVFALVAWFVWRRWAAAVARDRANRSQPSSPSTPVSEHDDVPTPMG